MPKLGPKGTLFMQSLAATWCDISARTFLVCLVRAARLAGSGVGAKPYRSRDLQDRICAPLIYRNTETICLGLVIKYFTVVTTNLRFL